MGDKLNVIFLDIDGVMKPTRCYFHPEKKKDHDGGFDELAVAIVNKLADRTGAVVVFNTTWNRRLPTMEHVKQFGIDMGLTCECVGKTNYPNDDLNRMAAIRHWLDLPNNRGKDIKWVALDDCPIPHDNAILVNPDVGVNVEDYRKATEILGNKDSFIVLI